MHDLNIILTHVQPILRVTNIIPNFFSSRTRSTQERTKVISCSQSQTVPQKSENSKHKIGPVAQTLQGAFFSFSLLHTDCRVCTQASFQRKTQKTFSSHGPGNLSACKWYKSVISVGGLCKKEFYLLKFIF